MKYLILIAMLLPTMSLADFCSPSSAVDVPLSWTPPTHREKDTDGIERVFPPEEIKGYIVIWNDVDKTEDSCSLQINLPSATSHLLKLQAGTNHRIRMQTIDTGTTGVVKTSTYSNEVFVTTTGTKPPTASDSPPDSISGMIVESR